MKYAALAAILLPSPVIALTPCEIAKAYQEELISNQSERRKARTELSNAIGEAATKETAGQMANLLGLVTRMATDDVKSYTRAAPLREALRDKCP